MPSPVKVGEWENIDDGLSLTFFEQVGNGSKNLRLPQLESIFP